MTHGGDGKTVEYRTETLVPEDGGRNVRLRNAAGDVVVTMPWAVFEKGVSLGADLIAARRERRGQVVQFPRAAER